MENIYLSTIRSQLEREVHGKLALHMSLLLDGAVTWVACVICWHKLQHKVMSKFSEKMRKFRDQKQAWKKTFMEIVGGKTELTTQTGAQ